jgi:hypothetical protein
VKDGGPEPRRPGKGRGRPPALECDRLVDIAWDASGELVSIRIDNDGDADGSETYVHHH